MIRAWRGVLFRRMPTNVGGNRRGAPMRTEDRGVSWRVRLTASLGRRLYVASAWPYGYSFHAEDTSDKPDLAFLKTAPRVPGLLREIVDVHP